MQNFDPGQNRMWQQALLLRRHLWGVAMFKRILIATDGSELSRHALSAGLEFAASIQASAIIVHITTPYVAMLLPTYPLPSGSLPTIEEHRKFSKTGADNLLVPALALAKEKGVSAASVAIEHEQPWRGILQVAKSEECDLICMASHGRRGLSALLMGSETQKVLTHSHLPVLVMR